MCESIVKKIEGEIQGWSQSEDLDVKVMRYLEVTRQYKFNNLLAWKLVEEREDVEENEYDE